MSSISGGSKMSSISGGSCRSKTYSSSHSPSSDAADHRHVLA
eukprot:gene15748-4750_t